jgi:hypothetical protein
LLSKRPKRPIAGATSTSQITPRKPSSPRPLQESRQLPPGRGEFGRRTKSRELADLACVRGGRRRGAAPAKWRAAAGWSGKAHAGGRTPLLRRARCRARPTPTRRCLLSHGADLTSVDAAAFLPRIAPGERAPHALLPGGDVLLCGGRLIDLRHPRPAPDARLGEPGLCPRAQHSPLTAPAQGRLTPDRQVPVGFLIHVKAFSMFCSQSVPPASLPRAVRELPCMLPRPTDPPSDRISAAQLPPEALDATWARSLRPSAPHCPLQTTHRPAPPSEPLSPARQHPAPQPPPSPGVSARAPHAASTRRAGS